LSCSERWTPVKQSLLDDIYDLEMDDIEENENREKS